MKVFTCTSFEGHWPVGTSAVIVAHDRSGAISLLEQALRSHGIGQTIAPEQLEELDLDQPNALILQDGNY